MHSSLTAVRCFDNGYVEKQPVAWKEYCAEYWLKELQESTDRCTGRRDITEILLKTALNTIQSINRWTKRIQIVLQEMCNLISNPQGTIFSSPEHIVLRMSYCDRSLSGAHPSLRPCLRL